jgi:steroid delta-isomerase-like uncharacterized protein
VEDVLMAEQDTVTIARKVFDAWNGHDPDGYGKLLASDYVSESDTMPAPVRGPVAARDAMRTYLSAFPDLHFTIEGAFAGPEATTVRWRANGTHHGALAGVPPTHRRVEVRGCSILTIRDDKVIHEWLYWDTGHLFRQLGAVPERAMSAGR